MTEITPPQQKPEIRLVGCMAHARRKFKDALDSIQKVKAASVPTSKPAQVLKDKSVEERYQIRQRDSRPVMGKLKSWLDKHQPHVPPKAALGKVVTYAQNQWPYLERYLDNGLLDIDNNAAERGIKPFVIGRKNWLFAQSPRGATASAILYSLVETAKANGLEPYAWLRHVLTELPMLDKNASVEHILSMNLTAEDLKIRD